MQIRKRALLYDVHKGFCAGRDAVKIEVSVSGISPEEKDALKALIENALRGNGYEPKWI